MGSSGGSSKNFWDQSADIGTNLLTLGWAGYQDGKIRSGALGEIAQKGWDDITGKTRARRDEMAANDAIAAEQARQTTLRNQEQQRKAAMDKQASAAAQSIRNSAASTSSFSRPNYRLNPDQDFLGL